MSNILKQADLIVNERSEEKRRNYGEFSESMKLTADLFNLMTGNNISTSDAYKFMVCLKMAREKHSHKEDNLLDSCAYIGALNNFEENKK